MRRCRTFLGFSAKRRSPTATATCLPDSPMKLGGPPHRGPGGGDPVDALDDPATRKLYLDGVIEQMWFKLDAPGVVFLVNAEAGEAAKVPVQGLPMGQAGLMDLDFIPVGPLAPLG